MNIVVKGRNVEVPDHFRQHVANKLAKISRFDHKIIEIDVELLHEPNPRQADHCQRVEITVFTRGPVVRAEAAARDFYSALDAAEAKLTTRLRRAADRRRVHRVPVPATATTIEAWPAEPAPPAEAAEAAWAETSEATEAAGEEAPQPWRIVREKEHPATPMTVEDALFQMELLGHDFYLFLDAESGRPSVVYRRRGYDYGVISLTPPAG